VRHGHPIFSDWSGLPLGSDGWQHATASWGRSTEEGEGDEERREKSGGARRGTIVFSQGTKRFWDGKRDERPNKEQSFTQCQIGEEIFLGTKEGTRKFYGVK
jgi:hypothetical protein